MLYCKDLPDFAEQIIVKDDTDTEWLILEAHPDWVELKGLEKKAGTISESNCGAKLEVILFRMNIMNHSKNGQLNKTSREGGCLKVEPNMKYSVENITGLLHVSISQKIIMKEIFGESSSPFWGSVN